MVEPAGEPIGDGGGEGLGAGGAENGDAQPVGGGGGGPNGGLSESDLLKMRQLEEVRARIARIEHERQMRRKQGRYNQRKI